MLPPVVVEPDRSLIERPEQGVAESMAAKKEKQSHKYDKAFKAEIVARALKARDTGSESWSDIAKEKGFSLSCIAFWIRAAKDEQGKSTNGASEHKSKSNDIKSVSRELADAMSQVEVLKKRLRKLLGE
jgi:transposase-like protein